MIGRTNFIHESINSLDFDPVCTTNVNTQIFPVCNCLISENILRAFGRFSSSSPHDLKYTISTVLRKKCRTYVLRRSDGRIN